MGKDSNPKDLTIKRAEKLKEILDTNVWSYSTQSNVFFIQGGTKETITHLRNAGAAKVVPYKKGDLDATSHFYRDLEDNSGIIVEFKSDNIDGTIDAIEECKEAFQGTINKSFETINFEAAKPKKTTVPKDKTIADKLAKGLEGIFIDNRVLPSKETDGRYIQDVFEIHNASEIGAAILEGVFNSINGLQKRAIYEHSTATLYLKTGAAEIDIMKENIDEITVAAQNMDIDKMDNDFGRGVVKRYADKRERFDYASGKRIFPDNTERKLGIYTGNDGRQR